MKEQEEKKTYKPHKKSILSSSTLDAFGSVLSAVVSAFALFVGISQFRTQTNELKYEREQRIKFDRPILSIEKNSVYNFKEIKQIKLVIKNIGVRPAYNLEARTIILRKNDEFSHMIYNQKDFIISYSNPIFNEQEVNFINNLNLVKNAEYYIRVSIQYYEENRKDWYKEDFYFKWKHSEDKEYLQDALYGIERELVEQIDDYIKKNNNY